MLSNPTSSIQQRRQLHRRQNSTPATFEAPKVRPLPAMIQQQRQHSHRRGMSLDQKPMLLSPFPDRMASATNDEPAISRGDSTVSITNLGQSQSQHTLQVAQQQSMAQPGQQFPQFQDTPHHQDQPHLHSHPQPHNPTQQALKDLEQHIKAVYGANATVQVNILPSPTTTSQKSSPMAPLDHLDLAPMPSSFSDACEINLDPPSEDNGFGFNLDNPESDNGYASSFYSSDAISPGDSPSTSPRQRAVATFQHDGHLAPAPQLSLSRRPSLLPMSRSSTDMDGYFSPSPTKAPLSPHAMSIADLNLDATVEETGISQEEIQAYISEQDQTTHRWTCLFPDCNKTFGRRENIRSHVQTHLGDRQYRCNGCGKCFVRQHDLKRHAKIHTGDKPYKCPCGAGFARQDALTRHRQRGMCDGAFPGAVKKQARRGRPRKNRPDMESRVDKASKTRRAQASSYESSSSSSSDASPGSSGYSPVANINEYDSSQFTNLHSLQTQSDGPSSSSFGFGDASSSPFQEKSNAADEGNLESATDTLFRLTAQAFEGVGTPPMSPAGNDGDGDDNMLLHVPKGGRRNRSGSPKQNKRTASGRTVSNPFSTPPSSPICGKQSLFDDEFDGLPSSSYDSSSGMPAMWDPFGSDLLMHGSGPTQDELNSFFGSMD